MSSPHKSTGFRHTERPKVPSGPRQAPVSSAKVKRYQVAGYPDPVPLTTECKITEYNSLSPELDTSFDIPAVSTTSIQRHISRPSSPHEPTNNPDFPITKYPDYLAVRTSAISPDVTVTTRPPLQSPVKPTISFEVRRNVSLSPAKSLRRPPFKHKRASSVPNVPSDPNFLDLKRSKPHSPRHQSPLAVHPSLTRRLTFESPIITSNDPLSLPVSARVSDFNARKRRKLTKRRHSHISKPEESFLKSFSIPVLGSLFASSKVCATPNMLLVKRHFTGQYIPPPPVDISPVRKGERRMTWG